MTENGSDRHSREAEFAAAFEHAFQQVYLRFHRRDGRRAQLPNASRAVLMHLAQAGPLTVTEAARHLDRAQSVVSDIVTHLERKGLLERESDPSDRRRTLVWLTPAGMAQLEDDARVLSHALLRDVAARLDPALRDRLLADLAELVDAAPAPPAPQARPATTDPTAADRAAPDHPAAVPAAPNRAAPS